MKQYVIFLAWCMHRSMVMKTGIIYYLQQM